MGEPRIPRVVTPLVGLLAAQAERFDACRAPLEELFGPLEFKSPLYPFTATKYYNQSMGTGLLRQFYSFKRLADPATLPDWKIACNALEAHFARQAAGPGMPERPINIDPGYTTGAKLVLASTKDFPHRIYLRDGIYAEVTMRFRGNKWEGHRFTFPDFASGDYDAFMRKVRSKHLQKVKHLKPPEK